MGLAGGLTIGTMMASLGTWFRMIRKGKEKGYTVAEMGALALRPPRWWPFAWPRRFRRHEDIWERLAPELKKARTILGWTGMLLTVNMYLAFVAMSVGEPQRILAFILFGVGAITGVGGFTLLTVRTHLWARRLGVEIDVMSKAVHTPTCALDHWRTPELSRLLLKEPPQDDRRKLGEPQTIQDLVEAIRRVEQEVQGENHALALEAVTAARQLVSSIESVERGIERASNEVDEGEVSKLEARLEALGDPTGGKDDFDADMRELIQNQLLLHRRLAERLESAKERHGRMKELLKLLWLNVSDLRAQHSQEAHDASEITGKIRTLCEDIGRHVTATEETVEVLTPLDLS